MKILGVIPARGESKGIPGKNVKPLGGLPLIVHTIRAAREAGCLDRLWVSTDDPVTARIADENGLAVPWLRPKELAADDSRVEEALLHLLERLEREEGYRPDGVLILQPTSPFRRAETIRRAVETFAERGHSTIVSVAPARQHPCWCYRIDSETGTLRSFMGDVSKPIPRQQLPDAYVVDGSIFLFPTDDFLKTRSMYTTATYPMVIPVEESIDIDTHYDWEIAEGLWKLRRQPETRRV